MPVSRSASSAPARVVMGLYYLALGTWFGATLMMGLGAGLTFRTLREQPLTLTAGPAARPELADRATDFLAGNVVLAGFGAFTVIQLVCGAVLALALVAQAVWFRDALVAAGRTWPNALRVATIALALALFAFDLGMTRPFMAMAREEIYFHEGISPEQLAAADRSFDELHARSSRSMGVAALLMAAGTLLSPFAFVAGPSQPEETHHG